MTLWTPENPMLVPCWRTLTAAAALQLTRLPSHLPSSDTGHIPPGTDVGPDTSPLTPDTCCLSDLWSKDTGPAQPILPEYPRSDFSKQTTAFSSEYFKTYSWLEYSKQVDAILFPMPTVLCSIRDQALTANGNEIKKKNGETHGICSERAKYGKLEFCVFDCVLPCTAHHPCCILGPSENRHKTCVQCSAGQHPRASGNEKKLGGDVEGDTRFL